MNANENFEIGEIVFSLDLLVNDGGIPGIAADAVLATPGRRGVVVNVGRAEFEPSQVIYLVRFEGEAGALGELGPPVGCLPDELTQQQAGAATAP